LKRILVVVAIVGRGVVADGQVSPKLMTPGTMAELPADTAGPWLALVENQGGFALIRTDVRVRVEPSPCDPSEKQTFPEADASGNVLFLFRGIPALREGPLQAGQTVGFLFPGQSANVALSSSNHWGIEAHGAATPYSAGTIFRKYQLRLVQGRRLSVFFEADDFDEQPHVVWTGDLDRDNVPDLIMDTNLQTAGAVYVLFLSSAARGGELVRRVVSFTDPSC
jgi:hypothetical protein